MPTTIRRLRLISKMRPYRKADDDMTPPSQIESAIVWNEKDDDDGRYKFRDASNDYVGKERTLQITEATVVDGTDTEATDAPDYLHHPKQKPGTLRISGRKPRTL